jgi:hypothetical protein
MVVKALSMLTRGNEKLGKSVWHFSLEAGVTCPGKTGECSRVCYASRNTFVYPNVIKRYKLNLRRSKSKYFVARMNEFLQSGKVQTVRIHSSGDFYSYAYISKWYRIVRDNPDIQFYAYTRSWRKVEGVTQAMRSALQRLAQLPNMQLWLSCDRESGRPPAWRGVAWAYMAVDDLDVPKYRPTLAFRVRRRVVIRAYENGTLVCPLEQGVDLPSVTCSTCRMCFNSSGKVLREEKVFSIALR